MRITNYLDGTLAIAENPDGLCALVRITDRAATLTGQRPGGYSHDLPVTRTTAETLAWWLHSVAERRRVWPNGCPTRHDVRVWRGVRYDSADPAHRDLFAYPQCGGAWWRIVTTRVEGSTMVYTERDGSLVQHPPTWRLEAVRLGYTYAATTAPARHYLGTYYSAEAATEAATLREAHLAWYLGDWGAPAPEVTE